MDPLRSTHQCLHRQLAPRTGSRSDEASEPNPLRQVALRQAFPTTCGDLRLTFTRLA